MLFSRLQHMMGKPFPSHMCYKNIRVNKNTHDGSFCAVNQEHIALISQYDAGSAFIVLPVKKGGSVDIDIPKAKGHMGPILDLKWNPFSTSIIASGSDDSTVKIWQIPDKGIVDDLKWQVNLLGHQGRVTYLEWHPTAANILLSAEDTKCFLWNIEHQQTVKVINYHSNSIFSIAWNMEGSTFATTSKDRNIRVTDPRSSEVAVMSDISSRSKVVFTEDAHHLLTVGFSSQNGSHMALWDIRNMNKPQTVLHLNYGESTIHAYYDYDLKIVFLGRKGGCDIPCYEVSNDSKGLRYLAAYNSSVPQKVIGRMPKLGCDIDKREIARFYKIYEKQDYLEPISIIVPQQHDNFDKDLFPPTATGIPSLSADQWFRGQNGWPICVPLEKIYQQKSEDRLLAGDRPSEYKPENTPECPKSGEVSRADGGDSSRPDKLSKSEGDANANQSVQYFKMRISKNYLEPISLITPWKYYESVGEDAFGPIASSGSSLTNDKQTSGHSIELRHASTQTILETEAEGLVKGSTPGKHVPEEACSLLTPTSDEVSIASTAPSVPSQTATLGSDRNQDEIVKLYKKHNYGAVKRSAAEQLSGEELPSESLPENIPSWHTAAAASTTDAAVVKQVQSDTTMLPNKNKKGRKMKNIKNRIVKTDADKLVSGKTPKDSLHSSTSDEVSITPSTSIVNAAAAVDKQVKSDTSLPKPKKKMFFKKRVIKTKDCKLLEGTTKDIPEQSVSLNTSDEFYVTPASSMIDVPVDKQVKPDTKRLPKKRKKRRGFFKKKITKRDADQLVIKGRTPSPVNEMPEDICHPPTFDEVSLTPATSIMDADVVTQFKSDTTILSKKKKRSRVFFKRWPVFCSFRPKHYEDE